jgi:hypothetical protein
MAQIEHVSNHTADEAIIAKLRDLLATDDETDEDLEAVIAARGAPCPYLQSLFESGELDE